MTNVVQFRYDSTHLFNDIVEDMYYHKVLKKNPPRGFRLLCNAKSYANQNGT